MSPYATFCHNYKRSLSIKSPIQQRPLLVLIRTISYFLSNEADLIRTQSFKSTKIYTTYWMYIPSYEMYMLYPISRIRKLHKTEILAILD